MHSYMRAILRQVAKLEFCIITLKIILWNYIPQGPMS